MDSIDLTSARFTIQVKFKLGDVVEYLPDELHMMYKVGRIIVSQSGIFYDLWRAFHSVYDVPEQFVRLYKIDTDESDSNSV